MGSPAFRFSAHLFTLNRRFPLIHACTLWKSRVKSRWNNSCHNWCYSAEKRMMGGMKRQQLLAILLFFSVIILGCLCMMTIPSPTTGGPAFVF